MIQREKYVVKQNPGSIAGIKKTPGQVNVCGQMANSVVSHLSYHRVKSRGDQFAL